MSSEDVRLRELEQKVALIEAENRNLKEKLDNLSGGINRGLWIIGGGFVMSMVSWIVGGGFVK